MSSAEVAAKVVKNLEPEDYKLLKVLASGLKQHESLTRKEITTYSKIHENIVDFRINRLHDMKLIGKNKGGFTLLMMGLDTVALKMLVDKDIIIAMGKPIGIGKESDVFEAITSRKQGRALKFFRIGNALNRLRHSGIRIPVLYYRAMHCVVMNRIDGLRLVNIHELEDPKITLQNILHDIGTAYKYNMINSDLSEYNVLLDSKNNIWIIDWPQVVSRSHPNAADLIKRDVYNIVNFFNRRFDLRKDKDEALNEVVLQ